MTPADVVSAAGSRPVCRASTGSLFTTCSLDAGAIGAGHGQESNCFQRCLLSRDGSTVVTYNQDRITRSFIVPHDIADGSSETSEPQAWEPYPSSLFTQSNAAAIYPWYDLNDPSTTVLLQGNVGLSIRLVNTLDLSHTHASYPWVSATTETWNTPSSLAFTRAGTHFIAGAKERIAVFDLTRDGEGPVMDSRTRATARTRKMYGEAQAPLSGLVSALAVSSDGVLAAGTTGRQIGLWDNDGTGQLVSTFSLANGDGDGDSLRTGSGVMHLDWSSCGTYLFIGERSSDAVLIYDMRVGKRLCWLQGRKAQTVQRMTFDLDESSSLDGSTGVDLWAGGCDGLVRQWKDVTRHEGAAMPDYTFRAHGDLVSSTIVHQTSRLLITASGQRLDPQKSVDAEDSEAACGDLSEGTAGLDNSLKIWSL